MGYEIHAWDVYGRLPQVKALVSQSMLSDRFGCVCGVYLSLRCILSVAYFGCQYCLSSLSSHDSKHMMYWRYLQPTDALDIKRDSPDPQPLLMCR